MVRNFNNAVKEAAKRAATAVEYAMMKYSKGLVADEDDLTGVLVGQLDHALDGQIYGLTWSTSIVRHRKGIAAEEKATGADMVFHVRLKTRQHDYAKGVLIQAKKVEPRETMSKADHSRLINQCRTMLNITPASFVFDYAFGEMRCASASRISGSKNRVLHEECDWTTYRFFLELFRCPIGDPRLTSAQVRELPVPTVLEISATDQDTIG